MRGGCGEAAKLLYVLGRGKAKPTIREAACGEETIFCKDGVPYLVNCILLTLQVLEAQWKKVPRPILIDLCLGKLMFPGLMSICSVKLNS